MKIILVGNGKSIIDREIGDVIDSYDVVVRFNNFIISGYEKNVGSKTTWWCRNELNEEFTRDENFEKIILRLKGEDDNEFNNGILYVLPELKIRYPNASIEYIPLNYYKELQESYRFKNSPLTGTILLYYLAHLYDNITIVGFDNLKGNLNDSRHYFNSNNLNIDAVGWHEPDKESEAVLDIIKNKNIRVL